MNEAVNESEGVNFRFNEVRMLKSPIVKKKSFPRRELSQADANWRPRNSLEIFAPLSFCRSLPDSQVYAVCTFIKILNGDGEPDPEFKQARDVWTSEGSLDTRSLQNDKVLAYNIEEKRLLTYISWTHMLHNNHIQVVSSMFVDHG